MSTPVLQLYFYLLLLWAKPVTVKCQSGVELDIEASTRKLPHGLIILFRQNIVCNILIETKKKKNLGNSRQLCNAV